ncbi:MAG: hypothetical protein ACQETK_01250 [Pseudomonadota bacterium]
MFARSKLELQIAARKGDPIARTEGQGGRQFLELDGTSLRDARPRMISATDILGRLLRGVGATAHHNDLPKGAACSLK